ncbi:glycosyltransferase family 39 protein [Streptomyces griseoviridis]|uniref:glycosyltransferase family 39 protein n=1 Tax=Streptomyces griseoviridis TaxID=45398 RepID=UPI0033D9F350
MHSESRWARATAVGLPAAVMSAIGACGLDRGGMWRDEGVTFQVARRTVPQIWRLLHGVDAVHGLYYLLMHAVLAVRADEIALRLPSVCGAAAAAGLVGALGARLAGAWAGCAAGLLYAATPMVGYYAQEGRSYALVSAGVLAATLLLVRAVDGDGPWRAYAAVLAVSCLLHELAALAVCAHAVSLACARVRRGVWGRWACAVGAVGIVTLPLALVSRAQSDQVAWLRTPGWGSAERLLRAFVPVPTGVVFWACVALALLGACAGPRALTGVALPLVLTPPALLIAVSRLRPMYDDRYVLYALAGLPLLTAGGLATLAGAATHALRRRARPAAGRALPRRARPAPAPRTRPDRTPDDRARRRARQRTWAEPLTGAFTFPGSWADRRARPGTRADRPAGSLTFPGTRADRPAGSLTFPGTRADRPAGSLTFPGTWADRRADARAPALAGVVALGLVVVPVLLLVGYALVPHRAGRAAAQRPDDLAALSWAAARQLRPGEPVLFLPAIGRRSALAYPAGFAAARDVALRESGARSGTLYGREVGAAELRRRLAGAPRLWVVAEPYALRPGPLPADPVERAKLALLRREFSPAGRGQAPVRGGASLRLYVRREPAARGPAVTAAGPPGPPVRPAGPPRPGPS